MKESSRSADVAVVGAGFGGLSAALELARQGRKVVVFEALTYPGGCAATFIKGDRAFESGATMFAGLAPGQWMRSWIERHEMDVEVELLDPVVDFRAQSLAFTVPASRAEFVEALCRLPDAPSAGIRSFFLELARTADTLWRVFDDPDLLPPLSARMALHHLRSSPHYLPILKQVGRPLENVLKRHGVANFRPLRLWLDAVCQITVQTDVSRAEAPITLSAVDYFFRGTAHIRGGVGRLAQEVCRTIERLGGTIRFADRVKRVEPTGTGFLVHARGGIWKVRHVVANVLPQQADAWLDGSTPGWLNRRVEKSWGAAALYATVRCSSRARSPFHVQCVDSDDRPLVEGNHVLLSVGEADESGLRSATASTHLPTVPLERQSELAERVQNQIRETLLKRVPEVELVHVHPASPRTFRRFTRRESGWVGGIPRLSGLGNYRQLWPVERSPGFWLTGDSTFPGQSVLAVAIGGHRVAQAIANRGSNE